MQEAHPQPSFGRQSAIDISFDNRGDRLIGLGVINGLLKILTLGIYGFWGKTEVRRRLWSFTKFNDEPLEYTGTGKELFLGFLIIFFVFVLPLLFGGFLVAYAFPNNQAALAVFQLAAYGLFFALLGNALYRAQRYRLSRTRWRGIRGAMEGSPASYGWSYFWTLALPFALVALLSGLTAYAFGPHLATPIAALGFVIALWVLPWRSNKLQRHLTSDMRFGDRPFAYSGSPRPLYKRYFFAWAGSALIYIAAAVITFIVVVQSGALQDGGELAGDLPKIPSAGQSLTIAGIWFLVLVLIGLITAWYRAHQMNHFARHTHFDNATFNLQASGKSLMWLLFSNWVISMFGVLVGLVIGGGVMYALGLVPEPPAAGEPPAEPGILLIITVMLPIILFTTLATTFAQFRSARYFLSRLKLEGSIDLEAIHQSANTGPRRGEGLAQVFDIDAF